MRKSLLLAVTALAGQLFAGGFIVELGNPDANPEAKKANAVLVVRAIGCHDPAIAKITGTAVGMVNGKRESIPLQLTKLSAPGTYALTQQWPKEGKWVLEFVGRNTEQFTNTLVAAGPNGIDRLHPKYQITPFTKADVESMLD
jgi:hypothetical protein